MANPWLVSGMASDKILAELRRLRGATTRIAERCNITRSAVSQWRHVPDRYVGEVMAIAREMGVEAPPQPDEAA